MVSEVYNIDCMEYMKTMPDNFFNLAIVDVPYGIGEDESKYTEDGVIIDINIEKDGETGETSIKNVSYMPLWVYKGKTEDGGTEHVVYPIMEYIESSELNEKSKARMQRSLSDTTKQMQSLKMGTAE